MKVRTEATAANAVVALDRVGKSFANGTVALEDISLAVRPGEFLSILGPSGCGKTTLLRLISGLERPSRGTVRWPAGGDEHGIGYVFQEPTLMPWAKVFANVHLPLKLKGVSRRAAHDRVMAALEMVGLADMAGHTPRELSGGMKMRVSIARAIVTGPRLLLMDEPFAALDEITRFKLNDDLIGLWERHGWTVVFVTHSVFESVYLSTRLLVMSPRPGRIVEEIAIDTPHPRAADFRISEDYSRRCRAVSDALRAAMAGGQA